MRTNRRIDEPAHFCIFAHFFILLIGLLFLAACSQTPTPTVESVHFTLVADSSSASLVEELVEAYREGRPHVTIDVARAVNAERTLEALQGGEFDLASVSWLPESEKSEGALWHQPFARDAIVMITHPTNLVGELTLLQLRGIFQGQTLFWDELGGLAVDVAPVSREAGAGTRAGFESLVMGGYDVAMTSVVMPSNGAVAEYVSATPGAIGYVASSWVIPSVNLLAVEGVTPSPEAVQDGRYLLSRPFYLVARAEPQGDVMEFVDWVKNGQGQRIVERNYAPAP